MNFNPLTTEIKAGSYLIEASAGTGKTYSIAALFTRLILFEEIPIEKIVVLTFTNAATAELKTRLRSRLAQVAEILKKAQLDIQKIELPDNDDFLRDLFEHAKAKNINGKTLWQRAHFAVSDFDRSSIYTILSFCHKILSEEAFVCHMPFSFEIETGKKQEINLKLSEDFWRKNIAHDYQKILLCNLFELNHKKIFKNISSFIGKQHLNYKKYHTDITEINNIIPKIDISDNQVAWLPEQIKLLSNDKKTEKLAQNFQKLLDRIKLTGTNKIEIKFWKIYPNLNKNSYRFDTFFNSFSSLQNFITINTNIKPTTDFLEKLEKIHQLENDERLNDEEKNIAINISETLKKIKQCLNDSIEKIHFDMLEYIYQNAELEKESSDIRDFNDLLLDVERALNNNRQALSEQISDKYEVLLVDEFQDTDDIQYDIFKKTFIEQNKKVFMVGDPKQAIYRFRGADIHAYLRAVKNADHRYSMNTNYRTHQKLIDVINRLFDCKAPFVYENIDYIQVKAQRENSDLTPSIPALTVLQIDTNNKLSDEIYKLSAQSVAEHMAYVLKQNIQYKQRNLNTGDIAVLVRSHTEAEIIRKALKQQGIESVSVRKDSVFVSIHADILYALMQFWLNPNENAHLWRFVLTSVLFNYTEDEIRTFNNDLIKNIENINDARKIVEIWQRKGIFSAYQYFAEKHKIEQRLIKHRDYRALSNISQLIETLAIVSEDYQNPHALLNWFKQQIIKENRSEETSDQQQLRLETDENLVKILTIHVSKGLEFPVVYCPFIYKEIQHDNDALNIIHQDDADEIKSKAHQSACEQQLVNKDMLSDHTRLLYVALTRAKESLIFCDTNSELVISNTIPSAIHYLLRQRNPEIASQKDLYIPKEYFRQPEKSEYSTDVLRNIFQDMPQDVVFIEDTKTLSKTFRLPESEKTSQKKYIAAPMPARDFSGRKFYSFTAWQRRETQKHSHNTQIETFETEQITPNKNTEQFGIHNFPAGVVSGLCLHEILEKFDFQTPASTQIEKINAKLTSYGFDTEKWSDTISQLLDRVRTTKLNNNISLSTIEKSFRLPEMEFLINNITFSQNSIKKHFKESLSKPIQNAIDNISQDAVQGFFNGFIDMLAQDKNGEIYIIDYKFNKLGLDYDDYQIQTLDNEMAKHHYAIQALIYALSVYKYLKSKQIYPKILHIRYLFLRGLQPPNTTGIWSWDIDCQKLAAFDKELSIDTTI